MFRGAYYNSGMSIHYNTMLKKYNVKSHKKNSVMAVER